MKILAKPNNRWGWARATSGLLLAGVALWTLLAALLRMAGEVSWLAWTGYQNFSLLDGVELAVIPLAVMLLAGWLEEQDLQAETELTKHREAERAAAAQQEAILQRVHAAVQALLPQGGRGTGIPAQARLQIRAAVEAVLPELNGKGKARLLHFLFEKGLLSRETPAVELKGLDFQGSALLKVHFNGICLEGVDLRKAKLDGAHLEKSRLSGANLSKARLEQADLREAGLAGCNLYAAHLEEANLEGADLTGAGLGSAFLKNANLKQCVLDAGSGALDQAILIETVLPDGRKMTNEKGKEYLRKKEMEMLIDKL